MIKRRTMKLMMKVIAAAAASMKRLQRIREPVIRHCLPLRMLRLFWEHSWKELSVSTR